MNQLFLLLRDRPVAGKKLNAFPCGNVAHIAFGSAGLNITAFLYEPGHGLQRLLEDQIILEGNLSVGLLHLPDTAAAKALVGLHINVSICGKDMIGDVAFHSQLKKQLPDPIPEHANRTGQNLRQNLRQII